MLESSMTARKEAPTLCLPRKPPRIDWPVIIEQLLGAGFTLTALARAIRIPDSTLDRYRYGSEPLHRNGETIIQAWCAICRRPRSDLPMRAV